MNSSNQNIEIPEIDDLLWIKNPNYLVSTKKHKIGIIFDIKIRHDLTNGFSCNDSGYKIYQISFRLNHDKFSALLSTKQLKEDCVIIKSRRSNQSPIIS